MMMIKNELYLTLLKLTFDSFSELNVWQNVSIFTAIESRTRHLKFLYTRAFLLRKYLVIHSALYFAAQ